MTSTNRLRIVLAVTGAGGTRQAGSVISRLVDDERVGHVDLMISANGRKLIAFEQGGVEADAVQTLLRRARWVSWAVSRRASRTRSWSEGRTCVSRNAGR